MFHTTTVSPGDARYACYRKTIYDQSLFMPPMNKLEFLNIDGLPVINMFFCHNFHGVTGFRLGSLISPNSVESSWFLLVSSLPCFLLREPEVF